MKRRTLIKSALLAAFAGAAGYGGWQAYRIFKTPDVADLKNHLPLINALAQTIIPKTADSPGAGDVNAAAHIVSMVQLACDKKTQNSFVNGLADIANAAHNRYNKAFENCSPEQQAELLTEAQNSGRPWKGSLGKVQQKLLGNSFFTTLKELSCEAWCTSSEGMNQGLAYDYVPGSFQGCVPLAPGQKSWATK